MDIVDWTTHTCEMSGSKFRKHKCERCRAVYGYEMKRTVRERASSLYGYDPEGAQCERRPTRSGHSRMSSLTVATSVPCPSCGWYQSLMTSAARDKACKWLATTWTACFSLGILSLMFAVGIINEAKSQGIAPGKFTESVARVSRICSAIAFVLSGLFFLLNRQRRQQSDLNQRPADERIALAKQCGAIIVKPPPAQGTAFRIAPEEP